MRKLPLGHQIWTQCSLNLHRRFIFEVGQQPSDAFEHVIASSLVPLVPCGDLDLLPEAKPYGAEPLAEKQIADAFAGFLFLVPGDIEDVHRFLFLHLIGSNLHGWIPVGALSSCGLFGKAG